MASGLLGGMIFLSVNVATPELDGASERSNSHAKPQKGQMNKGS
jgi:hypothetical protein